MKIMRLVLMAAVAAVQVGCAAAAIRTVGVVADTNGVIVAPTNLATANGLATTAQLGDATNRVATNVTALLTGATNTVATNAAAQLKLGTNGGVFVGGDYLGLGSNTITKFRTMMVSNLMFTRNTNAAPLNPVGDYVTSVDEYGELNFNWSDGTNTTTFMQFQQNGAVVFGFGLPYGVTGPRGYPFIESDAFNIVTNQVVYGTDWPDNLIPPGSTNRSGDGAFFLNVPTNVLYSVTMGNQSQYYFGTTGPTTTNRIFAAGSTWSVFTFIGTPGSTVTAKVMPIRPSVSQVEIISSQLPISNGTITNAGTMVIGLPPALSNLVASFTALTNLLQAGVGMSFATNATGIVLSVSATITISTNGVLANTAPTNINFIAGTNVTVVGTNLNGKVGLVIASPRQITNGWDTGTNEFTVRSNLVVDAVAAVATAVAININTGVGNPLGLLITDAGTGDISLGTVNGSGNGIRIGATGADGFIRSIGGGELRVENAPGTLWSINTGFYKVNGNSGVGAPTTLYFGGAGSGQCDSITIEGGIVTGYTTIP